MPIEDFNGDDLARLVKEAARAVDKMVRDAEGKGRKPKIYIHCTAGMGRAPAVACVYLGIFVYLFIYLLFVFFAIFF